MLAIVLIFVPILPILIVHIADSELFKQCWILGIEFLESLHILPRAFFFIIFFISLTNLAFTITWAAYPGPADELGHHPRANIRLSRYLLGYNVVLVILMLILTFIRDYKSLSTKCFSYLLSIPVLFAFFSTFIDLGNTFKRRQEERELQYLKTQWEKECEQEE